jgi:hypothetical protein
VTPLPTIPEMIHWVEMQTSDVELSDAEIERLLRVDAWIIEAERMARCVDGVLL